MAIKLPEKTWFTFHEIMERWQCTENDIRRLVIEQSLVPSIRTSEKLTMPDWEFEPSGNFEPMGRIGENSSVGYAIEYSLLNHWLYLRRPLRISTFDCQFRLASFGRDDPTPKEPDEVLGAGMNWHWIPEPMNLNDVIGNAAFLLEEVAWFETQHTKQDQQKRSEQLLQTKERNTLLNIIETDIDPADLPEELSAANIAFRAVTNGYGDPFATFKNRLIDYLENTYSSLNNEAVQRIATVANPDKGRGRKKSNIE